MHRSLIIQLGKAFDDAVHALDVEYKQRVSNGLSRDAVVRFMDAPPEAVGNLSNPVQILREKLERELTDCARELLKVGDSLGGELLWDVFFLINLGEPLVANAASVVFGMLEDLIAQEYETIFASHKRGSARRLRFIPIAVVPSNADCKRTRKEAIDELRQFHDRVVEKNDAAHEDGNRDYPVDRIFVLDAVTPYGVLQIGDLTDQVVGFLRLVLYSGIRTHAEFSLALEKEQNDLFGSFGCATLELDLREVSNVLTYRGTLDVAQFLNRQVDAKLPDPEAILPEAILNDPERLADALDELAALPARSLEADGMGALSDLASLYNRLDRRLETLRNREVELVEEIQIEKRRREERLVASQKRPWGWMSVTSLALGFAVFAVGFWWIVVPLAIALSAGIGFALLTALMLWFVTKMTVESETTISTTTSKKVTTDADDTSRVDLVAPVVSDAKRKIEDLKFALETLERSATDELAERVKASGEGARFRSPLASQPLYDFWYESHVGNITSVAGRFVEASCDGASDAMAQLLNGDAELSLDVLEDIVRTELSDKLTTLFDNVESREEVAKTLNKFVVEYPSGLPVFLEGISRQQFDPTGFVHPVQSSLYCHAVFQNTATRVVEQSAGPMLVNASSAMFDFFLLSITVDIHPDAVAILGELE